MLYSTAVYFRAKEDIIFKSYEAEALHGLLFKILSKVNANLATKVHDDINKKFTLSSFMPFTRRKGRLKILEKNREYKFRITFLDENLFHHFLTYFIKIQEPLFLNNVEICPTKILTTDAQDPWCSESTFEQLFQNPKKELVMIKFLTTTTFRKGDRQLILPLPESVFGSLLFRWQLSGGPSLSLQQNDFKEIDLSRYELKTRQEQFGDYQVKGFTGNCEYWLGNLDKKKREEVIALAGFGFYSGIGYKTTMGLGQIKIFG